MYEISARKIWKEKIKSMVYNETLLPKEDAIMKKNFISRIAPYIRKYDLDIIGRENIPYNSAVFICNHSNSHDFFTIQEVWNDLKRPVTPFGANDCLNLFSTLLFKAGNVTLIDRGDKKSSSEGMMLFSEKIVNGSH